MKMRPSIVAFNVVLVLGVCTFTSQCFAQAMLFLQDSVLAEFSAEEVTSFKQTIKSALEKSPDTQIIEWKSSQSELGGKILPKLSFTINGETCRRTAFQVTQGNSRKEQYRFDICKGKNGWGIVEPSFKFSKTEQTELEQFIEHSLESEQDGFPSNWKSSQSDSSIVLVPSNKSVDNAGNTCREAAIVLSSGRKNTVSGRFRFCKINDNWHYQPE